MVRFVCVAVAVLVGVVGLAPARPSAAATVELAIGSLSISTPANPSPASGSVVAGTTVNVDLATTTVTDSRVGSLGWTVTADATAPSDGAGHSVAKTQMSWVTKNLAVVSGLLSGVSVGSGGTFGATPITVATAVAGAGGGTYTYTATVTLIVPKNTFSASYTTTITQTAV